MRLLDEGLYDLLVTRRITQQLRAGRSAGFKDTVEVIDDADRPGYLARYLFRQIETALRAMPQEKREERQLALANRLLGFLRACNSSSGGDGLDPPPQVLQAVYRGGEPPQPPSTPLASSNLMVNARDEPKLGFEIERELASADSVLMLVSFIQWRGWKRLQESFQKLADRGAPVQILTTTYIGATDLPAVQELARLPNVQLKISLDGRQRRLHAKAWLFQRKSGFSSIYIGSANLSRPALDDGVEWTVKLSEAESPDIFERFRGAFYTLWGDREFEAFHPEDEAFCARVERALAAERGGGATHDRGLPLFFDLAPHPYQQEVLDRLESERADRGRFRNLIVAPTGTGKTLIAAFDYQRQPYQGTRPRLLFLAHREELLRQARDAFRHVLRDESFGSLLFGGEEPRSVDHLFATIQTFSGRRLARTYGGDYWGFVVLDETHHVAAKGYQEMLSSIQPRILLGLTATPERMDGASILPWFDNRIAAEMRLWKAIERQYLTPFDYYGISDGVDLSQLAWTRGAYRKEDLDRAYIGNNRRAELVATQFVETYGDARQARALGFCVSIAHAKFMAGAFARFGINAAALTGDSPEAERREVIGRLRRREINVLFTVDLFNEGIDIPEVDCVLFLRPTESSTIFLQQLGRGLRLSYGKATCLVLDFIGNQRREFRFDLRLQAMLGGTRGQLIREIESGITQLPGNCYFHLDREAQKVVLSNLKAQLKGSRTQMAHELARFAETLQRRPSLAEYLAESRFEISDVYKDSVGGWRALLGEAGLLAEPPVKPRSAAESRVPVLGRRLLHVDSTARLQFYRDAFRSARRNTTGYSELEKRMAQMLNFRLFPRAEEARQKPWDGGIDEVIGSVALREELAEPMDALLDNVKTHESEKTIRPGCPLFVHRSYQRDEVLVSLARPDAVGTRPAQTGRFWLEEAKTELLFVTLDKSGKTFSPSTRYQDYAVSRDEFHWQSQSTTSESTQTGQRYIHQARNGATFLLFVRVHREDAFLFLGPVRYISHTGSRPMNVLWALQFPLPAWFLEPGASFMAA